MEYAWDGLEKIVVPETAEIEFPYDPPMHGLNCPERPELIVNVPLGQYHCEVCGMMVLAGCRHPIVNNWEDWHEYARLVMYLHFRAIDKLQKKGLL